MGRFLAMSKLLLDYKIAVFVNWIFKSFYNRLISSFIFLTILYKIIFPYSLIGIILILIISLLFSLTITRVSNNFNLNLITGTLNMSLLNTEEYWKFSYIKEKSKISEKLKCDFIKGIIMASSYKKNIKMETHKWIVENVIDDRRIKSYFNIKVKGKKQTKIKSEILMLIKKKELRANSEVLKEIINRERKGYAVKLNRKE